MQIDLLVILLISISNSLINENGIHAYEMNKRNNIDLWIPRRKVELEKEKLRELNKKRNQCINAIK